MKIIKANKIQPITQEDLNLVLAIENEVKKLLQIDLTTHHTLHAGVYTRTAILKQGTVSTGSFMKIPTTILINGNLRFLVGKKVHNIVGFKAIPACANRKQFAYAIEDTYITMLFKTDAKTVEEAEEEFTDDFKFLISRNINSINIIGGI